MGVVELKNRDEIAAYLLQDRELNIYHLGDLDDLFWPYTRWYGWKENGSIEAVVLHFTGLSLPTVISLNRKIQTASQLLLEEIGSRLPKRFYAHLNSGHIQALSSRFRHGEGNSFLKMSLRPEKEVPISEPINPVSFTEAMATELAAFYNRVYPGNWFEPRMLEAGYYYGVYHGGHEDGELAAAAGVHVVSPRYRVAALGNIATDPRYRGQGLGKRLTAFLCEILRTDGIELIGLNVGRDNHPARAIYEQLGFDVTCEYVEMMMESKCSAGNLAE